MKRSNARAAVTVVFISACLLCLLCVLAAWGRNVILWRDAEYLLTSLAEVYSLPMAALIGALLAGKSRRAVPQGPFAIIMVLVIAWNVVLVFAFGTLPLTQQFKQAEIVSFCSLLSRQWSFLIVGALTYLTGSSAVSNV
jgi:hypothetical protein